MIRFQRLAITCLAATFVLVSIGGLVRATKSGLGCGDNWPHCPGQVDRALVIELSHRAAAGVVVILLAALALAAVKSRRRHPRLVLPSVAAFGLVLFQAVLGAVVVWLRLSAVSVVLHLATAMALIALLVHIVAVVSVELRSEWTATDDVVAKRARVVAGAVLVVLLAGSYVTGMDAGYAFSDWPLMGGRVVPDLSAAPAAVHFLHRMLAVLVGAALFAFSIGVARRSNELPAQAWLARVAAGTYAVEVVIGAANIWTRLNPAVVTVHLAVGAVVFACVAAIAIVSRPKLARDQARPRRVQVALESS